MKRRTKPLLLILGASSLLFVVLLLSDTKPEFSWETGPSETQVEPSTTTVLPTKPPRKIKKNQSNHPKKRPSPNTVVNDYQDLACKFARPDPWDPSIRRYIEHPRSIECNRVQEFDLSYMTDDGYVRINQSEWNRANKKYEGRFWCVCRTLDRPLSYTSDDNKLVLGYKERLEPDYPLRMASDAVLVVCKDDAEEDFYLNIHAHPITCAKRDFQDLDKTPEDQLSVLMMVIDSVSLSALKRNLPSTYKYLTEEMGFYVFNGYNKVGDNTRPNLFPVLTGKRIRDEQEDMPNEVGDLDRFLDKGPELIWKRYAKKNYSIVMNEDFSKAGLFHFASSGYHRKPADFYYHAMWSAVDRMALRTDSSRFCYGNTPKLQLQLDITRKHLEMFQHKLQFIFSAFAELSHDFDSDIERGDDMFRSFFDRIHKEKPELINRTVIVFMADHGHRFSDIRQTLVGLLEERLPMFLIRLPDWFYKKHPHIQRNLQTNTMRLSSPFDVHETLKDILKMNYDGTQRPWNSRGLSMLYPIPKNRTCNLAGIPEHFCTCFSNQIFDKNSNFTKSAANFLTKHLNRLLKNSTSWAKRGTSCHKLRWRNVTRAERIGVSAKVKASVRELKTWDKIEEKNKTRLVHQLNVGEKLRVAVQMDPKSALFEAELLYNGGWSNWTVLGDVARLNAYGNQSWCVQHEVIRKYCVCK